MTASRDGDTDSPVAIWDRGVLRLKSWIPPKEELSAIAARFRSRDRVRLLDFSVAADRLLSSTPVAFPEPSSWSFSGLGAKATLLSLRGRHGTVLQASTASGRGVSSSPRQPLPPAAPPSEPADFCPPFDASVPAAPDSGSASASALLAPPGLAIITASIDGDTDSTPERDRGVLSPRPSSPMSAMAAILRSRESVRLLDLSLSAVTVAVIEPASAESLGLWWSFSGLGAKVTWLLLRGRRRGGDDEVPNTAAFAAGNSPPLITVLLSASDVFDVASAAALPSFFIGGSLTPSLDGA
mmetsp:Transcript_18965/g.54997  ORF Transcript_18965/g.54997 Transcript_18965/m.54997 type:complete len:297 (-) Transcript_18965:13-903(-)